LQKNEVKVTWKVISVSARNTSYFL